MEEINYDIARVEGGISIFDNVLKSDRSNVEIGERPVPSPESCRKYAQFVESLVAAEQIPEEDEELLAAA